MICGHRNRVGKIKENQFDGFMETESTFEPQLLLDVGLGRYSSGGKCTLYMDGAKSTIRELDRSEKFHTANFGSEAIVEAESYVTA